MKKQTNYNTILCGFTLIVFSIFNLNAQSDLQLWTGYSAQGKVTKHWRVGASQLLLFNTESFDLSSVQNSATLIYRLNRKWNYNVGYLRSSNPSNPDQEIRNRLFSRVNLNLRWNKFRMANSFRSEWHFPERSKYEYRFRLGFRIHRGSWGLPLKTTPFITNEIHYYLSGKPLQYRDDEGKKVVKQSPNGLHAHRLTLGIRFRPFKRAKASISYMQQNEFNIGSKYREINSVDPRRGNIRRKFNNFSTLMFSFSYRLNFNNKTKRKTKISSVQSLKKNNFNS